MAARVHDSVLQTLALVQREAADPRRVAALARRQERELRAWLYPDAATAGPDSLAAALEAAAAEVEELHGVRVGFVRSGDAPLDDGLELIASRRARRWRTLPAIMQRRSRRSRRSVTTRLPSTSATADTASILWPSRPTRHRRVDPRRTTGPAERRP